MSESEAKVARMSDKCVVCGEPIESYDEDLCEKCIYEAETWLSDERWLGEE